MRTKNTIPWTLLIAALLLLPGPALAQSTFSEGAAAEALFREGAKRFEDGELAEACEKFAASQDLEPAPGTALRLGDCYDRIGKTASAWATFQEAAALARSSGQSEREETATERAEELFGRLSYLTIQVARETRSLEGVRILIGGREIPGGTWGTPIPIDPGTQNISVRATGYREWKKELTITNEPGEQAIEVPVLQPLVREVEAATPAAAQRERTTAPQESEVRAKRSGSQRVLAYVAGGLGLAGLGASGYFTYRAYALNEESLPECLVNDANACTPAGKALRDDAREQGTFATIAASAGFALVGVSVVLFLTEPDEAAVAGAREVRLVAGAGAGPSLGLGGTW